MIYNLPGFELADARRQSIPKKKRRRQNLQRLNKPNLGSEQMIAKYNFVISYHIESTKLAYGVIMVCLVTKETILSVAQ
jgi:hypothetical protein